MDVLAEKSGWVVEYYMSGVLAGYEIDGSIGESPWIITQYPFYARLYPTKESALGSEVFDNLTNEESVKIKFMRMTCKIEPI